MVHELFQKLLCCVNAKKFISMSAPGKLHRITLFSKEMWIKQWKIKGTLTTQLKTDNLRWRGWAQIPPYQSHTYCIHHKHSLFFRWAASTTPLWLPIEMSIWPKLKACWYLGWHLQCVLLLHAFSYVCKTWQLKTFHKTTTLFTVILGMTGQLHFFLFDTVSNIRTCQRIAEVRTHVQKQMK